MIAAELAERPAWKLSRAQYQALRGVHEPFIGEVSGLQLSRMSGAARRRYAAQRRVEWDASAAVKADYAEAVVAAYDRGEFSIAITLVPGSKTSDGVHRDAWEAVVSALVARKKERAELAIAAARRASERGGIEAKEGDIVYDLMGNRYARVLRAHKKSLRLVDNGRGWAAPRGRVVWMHFNDYKRCAELGIAVGAGAWAKLVTHDQTKSSVYTAEELKKMDEPESYVAGDSVTPLHGIFRGTRFMVMDSRPRMEHPGDELLVRPFPARQGGPSPLWVPADELAPFFSPRTCRACGDAGHTRCEQSPEFPEVGWRVCTQYPLAHEVGIPAGCEGTVATADRQLGQVRVDFDNGSIAEWGASIVKLFFFDMRVL